MTLRLIARFKVENFKNAKWIWHSAGAKPDEYAEFYETVEYGGGSCVMNISADSNYALYVNGSLAAFGQYADFPYDKVYDARDITSFMRRGKNVIAIRVWYYGIDFSSTYYPGEAGVIYSLFIGETEVLASSSRTLSRPSPAYVHHKSKTITWQLGLSFEYDAKEADAWLLGEPSEKHPFTPSYETGVAVKLRPRTCLPVEFGETCLGTSVPPDKCTPVSQNGVIFDLGKECVGFPCIDFVAEGEQKIVVAFGEHLEDGHVRAQVGGRDFTFIYHATEGRNYYMNPFRRCGCRYIELIPEGAISSVSVSLRTTVYPVNILPAPDALTPMQRKIYDACVYTLCCCMHEHYEDCPWREQALYAMDSRNQMLTGYYAFGEHIFPKANLELIAADNREDGLLSICYPIKRDLVIPSFSLHYVIACEEYLTHTGDLDFIRRIRPKLLSVLDVFLSRIGKDGLVAPIPGEGMWNFYEWIDGLDGRIASENGNTPVGAEPDVVLNSLLCYALSKMEKIDAALGKTNNYTEARKGLNTAINKSFFDTSRGVFKNRASSPAASELGNSLAILCGAANREARESIADAIISGRLDKATLSMKCFVYDALLILDRDKYKPYVLEVIERTYTPMIEYGGGTVWETELGAADFDNAGSLCHGWSAIPAYYYHKLLG